MNGFKGIVGLIALAYFGYLPIKAAMAFHSTSLDLGTAVTYGVWLLAYGGLVFASFATRAYRFSCTRIYYLAVVLLMAQIGWVAWHKAVQLSNDTSVLEAEAPPDLAPPHAHAPAPSQPVAAIAVPPPPKSSVPHDTDTGWAVDGPSGSVMITPETSKYLNKDHLQSLPQPIPVPNITATQDDTNNATAAH